MNENTVHPPPDHAKAKAKPALKRVDELLVARGIAPSRSQARQLLMAGQVVVEGHVIDKAGKQVPEDSAVEIKGRLQYVSRGGLKLEAALDAFRLDPTGRICADIGASTGGFTDCLLQRGAARVYAIDVGYGQLAWSLRTDPRVVVMERVNARTLETLPEGIELAAIDVSFIGLRLVLPTVARLLVPTGETIALIKPQFEVGKELVGKGGVVRDPKLHRIVIERVLAEARAIGFDAAGVIRSPLRGPAGNHEFLAWLRLGSHPASERLETDKRALDAIPA
jgi:23S rRNA (cytidine1920-2'-O)/16S rRNA (cytidine1409-2'-O)-methyltransferase